MPHKSTLPCNTMAWRLTITSSHHHHLHNPSPSAVHLHSTTTPPLRRPFSTTSTSHASPFFALAALSNSRESQHFRKITRLSQVEHSTPLELIRNSEVDPFLPRPPASASGGSTAANPRSLRSTRRRLHATSISRATAPVLSIPDTNALSIGRALLASHATRLARLRRRARLGAASRARESAAWAARVKELQRENRAAVGLMLAAIAAATGAGLWRFGRAAEPRGVVGMMGLGGGGGGVGGAEEGLDGLETRGERPFAAEMDAVPVSETAGEWVPPVDVLRPPTESGGDSRCEILDVHDARPAASGILKWFWSG